MTASVGLSHAGHATRGLPLKPQLRHARTVLFFGSSRFPAVVPCRLPLSRDGLTLYPVVVVTVVSPATASEAAQETGLERWHCVSYEDWWHCRGVGLPYLTGDLEKIIRSWLCLAMDLGPPSPNRDGHCHCPYRIPLATSNTSRK